MSALSKAAIDDPVDTSHDKYGQQKSFVGGWWQRFLGTPYRPQKRSDGDAEVKVADETLRAVLTKPVRMIETDEQRYEVALAAVKTLREHFDDVQILASWLDENTGNTKDAFAGSGNFYARQGMAHEFISRDEAQVSAREIAAQLNPEDED